MNNIKINNLILNELKIIANKLGIEKIPVLIDSRRHGDFTSNIAMGNKKDPIILAQEICALLEPKKAELSIDKIEIAKPGFINFYLNNNYIANALKSIVNLKDEYGKGNKKGKVNVEFVSANPTGYLHVGHARNAAIGSAIANIFEFAGMDVTTEYYINDAGAQINILAESLYARYQQIFDENFSMPEECYRGEDIIWAANEFYKKYNDKYKNIPLKKEVLKLFKEEGLSLFLCEIKKDLARFNVFFDKYFSEKSLYENNKQIIKDTLSKLKNTYQKDGATWLKTTIHGDDKDRVLIKENGEYTYFMPDIAYHNIKFNEIGKDGIVMNIWGADHSGYIKRMQCAMKDLGQKEENLNILCMQLVRLIKNGEEFKMSKRKGTSFFLREFIDIVGVDSARFILLDRTYNTKLDFDINIATSKTNDNPVILVQYANARAFSLLEKANYAYAENINTDCLNVKDIQLTKLVLEFPEIIKNSAEKQTTNMLTQYLIKLAKEFNSWYSNSPKVIESENAQTLLMIVKAVNITIENGLRVLGISIKHNM
ncbi:arginine--tRNA ligase [Mycoplasma sp. M5725]|uniref:Arginine--tRNA ligase n=1 Tax=Mycoplasma phocimorsus TaxID=3045839 RepID=A0AAJ1UWR7_9MOLU|nr:arginine--tRNA ligase [Mycoplasma phocimorsus]MDJ1645735.1 arginine--tRNA ligase [Mycoplasma phocimorsus]